MILQLIAITLRDCIIISCLNKKEFKTFLEVVVTVQQGNIITSAPGGAEVLRLACLCVCSHISTSAQQ